MSARKRISSADFASLQTFPGQLVVAPAFLTSAVDCQAVGTTLTDMPGMSLGIPASTKSVIVRARICVVATTGTSAAASVITPQIFLTDSANVNYATDSHTFQPVTAASVIIRASLFLECVLVAPVSAMTMKLRYKLLGATPANWTAVSYSPQFLIGGSTPGDALYAVYA